MGHTQYHPSYNWKTAQEHESLEENKKREKRIFLHNTHAG